MRVVSVSPVVPSEDVAHAGGQYYLRHLRALLRSGAEITIVALDTAENREARSRLDGVAVVLLPARSPTTRAGRLRARWARRLHPARPVDWPRRSLLVPSLVRLLREADVVEFQWTETAWIGRGLRRWTDARTVVVAHDVLTQSYERHRAVVHRKTSPRGVLASWRVRSVGRDEARIYRAVSVVLVFSSKDARLVDRVTKGGAAVEVVRPPLAMTVRERTAPSAAADVLFVGAFDRSVNAEAAVWAMTEIAPLVHRRHPHARFVFAGAHPPPSMLEREAETIHVTGRVRDLEPFYESAAVVLVPLRSGAGVKFKTVEAMVRGIPVVSTSVGVEGIVDDHRIRAFAVADDAAGLAHAVCRALDDPAAARQRARAVQGEVAAEFSPERFERHLAALYRTRSGED